MWDLLSLEEDKKQLGRKGCVLFVVLLAGGKRHLLLVKRFVGAYIRTPVLIYPFVYNVSSQFDVDFD